MIDIYALYQINVLLLMIVKCGFFSLGREFDELEKRELRLAAWVTVTSILQKFLASLVDELWFLKKSDTQICTEWTLY